MGIFHQQAKLIAEIQKERLSVCSLVDLIALFPLMDYD